MREAVERVPATASRILAVKQIMIVDDLRSIDTRKVDEARKHRDGYCTQNVREFGRPGVEALSPVRPMDSTHGDLADLSSDGPLMGV